MVQPSHAHPRVDRMFRTTPNPKAGQLGQRGTMEYASTRRLIPDVGETAQGEGPRGTSGATGEGRKANATDAATSRSGNDDRTELGIAHHARPGLPARSPPKRNADREHGQGRPERERTSIRGRPTSNPTRGMPATNVAQHATPTALLLMCVWL